MRVLNGSGVTGAAATADQALANLGFVSGGISNYTGPPRDEHADPLPPG